jgi:hypothetical protein
MLGDDHAEAVRLGWARHQESTSPINHAGLNRCLVLTQ